jgi:protocatechuate 3,4-dioxygenase beta subunit
LGVERSTDGHWRRVASAHTDTSGRYRAELGQPGVYRVRAGTVAGPRVRLR